MKAKKKITELSKDYHFQHEPLKTHKLPKLFFLR